MVAGEDGRWLLTAPLQPLLKPGGHGVIWKLMLDSGVFDWLRSQGREAAIVRQIRCATTPLCAAAGAKEGLRRGLLIDFETVLQPP